ncbi:TetR/AcrR family transcriptional regulator [Actinomyces israelii]|uniref:TetR/AcrR family transcriptional regulator n=1 Tax=Actinomyces israelii TaxID=1659 RepID=UPI0023527DFA|nr:TetR/AcrR family transcriptional regulator [Actinomyces israelii]
MPSGRRSTATDRARRGAAAEPTASPTPTRGRLSAPAAGPSAAIAPPDGRTRYANGERRRAEIIDAAMKVFAEQGFNSLSLRQIAEAVGVSHTLLRHHFGTKDTILQAVLTRREETEARWRADLFAEHGLLEALPRIMEHNAAIPGLIQLDSLMRAEAVNPDHPAHEYVIGLARRFRAQLRADLAAEQAAGRIREDLDLELTATQLVALIEGVQSEWLLDRSVDMPTVVRSFAEDLRAT